MISENFRITRKTEKYFLWGGNNQKPNAPIPRVSLLFEKQGKKILKNLITIFVSTN